MKPYDHKAIERKWQERWLQANRSTVTNSDREKFYLLVEFPYPSGNLHVGHWYAFSVPDMLARFLRMQGKNVLFPIGFDAFGLPAENAAIKRKLNPREWTYSNIEHMRKQLHSMGASFDWSREVITCDPAYYKWTQWQFLQFFKKGLAYQAPTPVNWCPTDKTVLANEQVVDGRCERCGTEVEQRNMVQWNIRITDYADRLVDDLDPLDWPPQIKESQRNWIGRSEGALIKFPLKNIPGQEDLKHVVDVFTTRSDTLFGVTFLAVSPELAQKWIDVGWKASDEVQEYIRKTLNERVKTDRKGIVEKTGVFSGINAVNPGTQKEIPVWIANYILGDVGTGAIMAVPAHDERDFDFAKKFKIDIKPVVSPGSSTEKKEYYEGEGILIDSGSFTGLSSQEARKKITEAFGTFAKTYRLRDWVISRQRYWGVPIPIIHCKKCGPVAVPDKELPVVLPEVEDYLPTGDGKSPLAKVRDWVEVTCPTCGEDAQRETDTFDTFVDSSWYFLRYTDPHNENAFASKESMEKFMPVDLYSGGSEHTTMHVLYSRFWQKALFDIGLVRDSEPYRRRMNRGLIMGPDGQKMSKSKGNVIDPDEVVLRLGADTVRMYLAFIGPYYETGAYPWNPDGIVGVRKFLERVWKLKDKLETVKNPQIERLVHKLIDKITSDIPLLKFNTSVAAFMAFLNAAEAEGIDKESYETFLKLLAPFAPHIAEEIWASLGNSNFIHETAWPKASPELLIDEKMSIVVQVNGKKRAEIYVCASTDEETIKQKSLTHPDILRFVGTTKVDRVIYVPGRLVNIVVKGP